MTLTEQVKNTVRRFFEPLTLTWRGLQGSIGTFGAIVVLSIGKRY